MALFAQFSPSLPRGLTEKVVDFQYVPSSELTFNGQIVFEGLSNGLMIFDISTNTWAIYNGTLIPNSTLGQWQKNVLATYQIESGSNGLPIGLKPWKIHGNLDSKPILLKFTQCKENQFTCHNGLCIGQVSH